VGQPTIKYNIHSGAWEAPENAYVEQVIQTQWPLFNFLRQRQNKFSERPLELGRLRLLEAGGASLLGNTRLLANLQRFA
jgi:hypothetical protein